MGDALGYDEHVPTLDPTKCQWCQINPRPKRGDFCHRKCRQRAFRLRRYRQSTAAVGEGLPPGARFAYADPPYVGLSKRYYGKEDSFAGEVDHRRLVESLECGGYAGWALSCSSASLRELLPLCPPAAKVCPWTKPIGVPKATLGAHNAWEAVIIVGGRKCSPGVRDWLCTQPARLGGGTLIGRKPLGFCAWLFDLLGMLPGDELVDFYPGTGGVSRAWREVSLRAPELVLKAGQRRPHMLSLVHQRSA